MDKKDLEYKQNLDMVIKFAKDKLTDFRVDERRKVRSYIDYDAYSQLLGITVS